ncbi:peptidylprolyl isomerase [Cochlodiniinecator piscidefendens]|uniref:peptidylprolyl isomerase n=1 Tax=Cochlodiniinecator piscidefendens TaxID=2715756 RepID=UPI0014093077|nr:peptidylprolyl isomerase [Cochlodiniinecator piscidefendens]
MAHRPHFRFILAFFTLCWMALAPNIGTAQNLFAPVARVNDQQITQYEFDQRMAFMALLRAPGNPEEEAMKGLVDDRLRMQEARRRGVIVSEEQIAIGMEEFAQRAELSTEQFLQILSQGGITEETFRDFVRSGLAWREIAGGLFASRVQISESELDRAIALASGQGGVRVLLSEIILPAPEGQTDAPRRRAQQLSQISTLPAFAAAARQYSASPSRGRGGRLDWLPIGNLPPAIRSQVLTLSPGEVTEPIDIPGGIILFQMRALEETAQVVLATSSIEYAIYDIPGGHSAQGAATDIRNSVDSCDDLYGIAHGQPEEVLTRVTLPVSDIPEEIALQLALLDTNEVSTSLTNASGDTLLFLMLCGRVTAAVQDVDREDIRNNLRNQRIGALAENFLAELRADATIIYP